MSNIKQPALGSVVRQLWPIYMAYLISQLGNWMFRASVLYEIYDRQGGSSSLLGSTVALIYLPIMVGGRFLSPYADHISSKRLLVGLDIVRALILLPLLYLYDMQQPQHVLVALAVIVLLSLSSPLFSSAQSAYIRRTVPPEQVTSAVAVVANLDWLTNLLGTVLGPILLLVVSFRSVIIIDILTFAVSLVLLLFFMRERWLGGVTTQADQPQALAPARAYLVPLSIFLLNLGAGVVNIYPPVVARDVYHLGEVGLSQIYLGNGICGFLGALCVHRIRRWSRPVPLIMTAALLIASSIFGMQIFQGFGTSVLASSAMLFFGQIFGVVAHAYLLSIYPVTSAGKATGLFMVATFSGVACNALLFTLFQFSFSIEGFSLFLCFCALSAFASLIPLRLHEGYQRKLLAN